VIVGGILVVGAFAVLFLVLFSSQNTKIRTLFSYPTREHEAPENGTDSDSAPLHPWLDVFFAVLCITSGSLLIRTGEARWMGTGTNIQAYGPSVRAAGLVMIFIGLFCSYPSVMFLCRRVFRAFKGD
jgi:uncharacterized membrane protein